MNAVACLRTEHFRKRAFMGLVLFRNPGKIAEIHRNLFTEVLKRFTDCLGPEVAALLVRQDLGFEDY